MGSRSAPLVFLLLTACMAADGMPSATREGSATEQNSAAAASVQPVALPAIPRMRPNAPRKTQSARAPVQTDAVKTAGQRPVAATAGTELPGDRTGRHEESLPAGKTADAAIPERQPLFEGEPPQDSEPPPVDAEPALLRTVDGPSGVAGTLTQPAPPTDPAAASASDPDTGPEIDLAALPPPELDRGIDVESLFDGDVVRYCAAMWQMGEYIGAARRRGEPFKQAIVDAVRRIADEKQLPLDNRLAFSGQVYGRLVYRLEDSHAAETLGTYVHFACLTVRGDKKIVPADPNAERLLNGGLALCENTAVTRDALNDCIFRELTPIVDRRNS